MCGYQERFLLNPNVFRHLKGLADDGSTLLSGNEDVILTERG